MMAAWGRAWTCVARSAFVLLGVFIMVGFSTATFGNDADADDNATDTATADTATTDTATAAATLAPLVQQPSDGWDGPLVYRITDQPASQELHASALMFDPEVEEAQLLLQPTLRAPTTALPSSVRSRPPSSIIGNAPLLARMELSRGLGLAFSVPGSESKVTQSTDVGQLLRKATIALGATAVARQPIVNDSKVRGNRTPQLNKNGSYWIPARMDLDTALSKIDSRLLQEVSVIKGPYSSLYGPGFSFVDFQLKPSPRYNGFEYHGETSIDYQTNGQQWYGRQTVLGGDNDSGFRLSYGHRTGNDYKSGNGTEIPASYKSRDVTFSYGLDLSPYSRIEFSALRLDQTDVEMPGQAFDIDYLVTDAYEIEYINQMSAFADSFAFSTWYNRTELAGSTGRPGKARQFPYYESIDFVGTTDVDSLSTGYTAGWTWGSDTNSLTAGTDMRYVKQELNEITSGEVPISWDDRNSPIPRSHQSNPGLFTQQTQKLTSDITLTKGGRIDFVSANIDDDADKLSDVGVVPFAYDQIVGGSDFDRDFTLGSVFLLADVQLTQCWSSTLGYGYAERAPSLTELYAAESFMFLLQNGLNSVTGDPNLDKERLWQIDVGLSYDNGRLRGGINGYHAWVRDYITFEATDFFNSPADPVQTNLKFVNTDLATLAGGEMYAEYDTSPWLTTFATLSFVEGRDHSRNGDFATEEAGAGNMGTQRVAGLPRGSFSGIAGASEEPLPNIRPLEARVGIRLHEATRNPNWGLELTARIVDNQDRIATSLLESETPGFTIWDIRGYLRTRPGMLLVAGIENLTDKQFREYQDFRSPSIESLSVFQPGVNFYFGTELMY